MKKIFIFGINDFASLMRYYIESTTSYTVEAFTVNKEYISNNHKDNIKVIPYEDIGDLYTNHDVWILVAVGYSKMNDIRRKVIRQVKDSKFNLYSYVHPTSVIASNSIIGEGNIILEKCIVQPYVVIGEGNIFWSNVNVSHHDLIGDFNYFSPSVSLSGNVTIHNNCFFGNNCVIKNSVEVQNYSLIGAGAYLSQSSEQFQVYVPQKGYFLERKSSRDINLI